MYPHLALAEQAAREDGDAGDGHVAALGHQVGGHGKLGDVEFLAVEHAAVAVDAVAQVARLSHLEHLELVPVRRLGGAVEEREMAVVALDGDGEFFFLGHVLVSPMACPKAGAGLVVQLGAGYPARPALSRPGGVNGTLGRPGVLGHRGLRVPASRKAYFDIASRIDRAGRRWLNGRLKNKEKPR